MMVVGAVVKVADSLQKIRSLSTDTGKIKNKNKKQITRAFSMLAKGNAASYRSPHMADM